MSYSSNKFNSKMSSSNNGIRKNSILKNKGFYDSLYMSDSDDECKKNVVPTIIKAKKRENGNGNGNGHLLSGPVRVRLDTKNKEEFPLLSAVTRKLVENTQIKISYADKLKTPLVKKEEVGQYKITIRPNTYSIMENVSLPIKCESPLPPRVKNLSIKKSWADYSDSDDDDEDW